MKLVLGMEVALSPGDFVLDGDPDPSPKGGGASLPNFRPISIVLDGEPVPAPRQGADPQIFGPCLLWPNGWMYHDATWYGGRPRPKRE